MTTVNAIDQAKQNYKAALLAQIEPISQKITALKGELSTLEIQRRTIEAQVKLIDKGPTKGREWTPEAKAKLSIALKAAAARKKEAAAQAQAAPAAAPVVDNKMRAANDDSAAQSSKKKTTK